MQRTIVPDQPCFSEEIAPGVTLRRLYPGGLAGPNGEVHLPTPGGQTWSDTLFLGTRDDAFQLMVPDIRLPANQLWPLHWHDCWTVVLVLEGSCCIGDWWMEADDVFLAAPSVEYGPLLIGPRGCRMFEIFAQGHLSPGGYAPEYRDHPTLAGGNRVFQERSTLNRRNDGRQVMPCDGIDGIWTSRLAPGAVWDLGEAGDPERGVMCDVRLEAGEALPARTFADWHGLIVLGGSLRLGELNLGRDDCLLVAPGGTLDVLTGGPEGAHLLRLARTAAGSAVS